MNNFSGKHIWIIGASSGIGEALARELSARGAKIALSARREDKLNKVCDSLSGTGHCVLPLDVLDGEKIESHFETLQNDWPQIDSIIFLAAMYDTDSGQRKNLDDIHQILQVNIGGAFEVAERAVTHYSNRNKGGQIVLCGSVAGYKGLPKGQPYCATKAAIISYAESLKVEVEAKNIDVKLICPGFVKTPLTDKNKFDMPFIISPEEAADYIADGLLKDNFEIHFPKRFTYMMKIFNLLPYPILFALTRKILKKA